RALTEDGALALECAAEVWPTIEAWVPRVPPAAPDPSAVRARLVARAGTPAFDTPETAPALDLRGVLGWIAPGGDILLRGTEGRVSVVVRPATGVAEVRLPAGGEEVEGVEIFAALTLASAFLLGRLRRTLVHAGAVVGHDGRAWLLAGGTFSGKSTTCVGLIRAGWDWLADDHVVLRRAEGEEGLSVEGWPRRFNLDRGYAAGESRGERARVDPAGFGPGRWRRSAPLGGLLFPRVEAETPTSRAPLHPAGALARLLQQSPWLLADAGAAPAVLALLEAAASSPAFELRLGFDSFVDPFRLVAAILPSPLVLGPLGPA
ncbi:MAG TPA: hypothetical protein VFQ39_16415, partial [Longimicrobium sp.]|nr:hypothetical protein [Longimicrobium sp.]